MDVFWTLPPVTRFVFTHQQASQNHKAYNSSRTITALAVVVSALGHSGMIGLYNYYYYAPLIFTLKTTPQVWRLFTAFLITKPKFAILMDPYFLYQYGSSVERESSRFSKPGDFFVYTAFVSTVIVVSGAVIYICTPNIRSRLNMARCIDTSVCYVASLVFGHFDHLGLSARPAYYL
jgi:Derlin-2/3